MLEEWAIRVVTFVYRYLHLELCESNAHGVHNGPAFLLHLGGFFLELLFFLNSQLLLRKASPMQAVGPICAGGGYRYGQT